jgi:hypothetical protein
MIRHVRLVFGAPVPFACWSGASQGANVSADLKRPAAYERLLASGIFEGRGGRLYTRSVVPRMCT